MPAPPTIISPPSASHSGACDFRLFTCPTCCTSSTVAPYIATTSATRVPFCTSNSLASIWIGARAIGAAATAAAA